MQRCRQGLSSLERVCRATQNTCLAALARRGVAAEPAQSESDPDKDLTIDVNAYRGHHLESLPETSVKTSKAELIQFFRDMYTMRRMELSADSLYKQKLARGFLHLADGACLGCLSSLRPAAGTYPST